MKKLKIIEGDLSKLQLGLSSADRQLLIENVQIVFHVAADVRFDESLKERLVSFAFNHDSRFLMTIYHSV